MVSFDTNQFFYRARFGDFVTSFALSLLLLTCLILFSDHVFLDGDVVGLIIHFSLIFLFMPLNHIVYKYEHGFQNNYIGRVLHDCIFLCFLLLVITIHKIIVSDEGFSEPTLDYSAGVIFLMVLVVMPFELILELFKVILKKLGWEVF
jgi:hypothetical protein